MNFDFRPRNLDEVLGQPKAVAILRKVVASLNRGVSPSNALFFEGPPGTGKTSTAYALAGEITNSTVWERNCGESTAVSLREELESIAGHRDWNDGNSRLIVLLDEFERITKNDRISLRRPLELAASHALIVITANEEIGDPGLESRTRLVEFVRLDDGASRALIARVSSRLGLRPSEAAILSVIRDSKGDGRAILDNIRIVEEDLLAEPMPAPSAEEPLGRSKGGRKRADVDAERCAELRRQGMSWTQIGKSVGHPASTVRDRVLEKYPDLAGTPSGNPSGN
ncbi:MAG: AAA family ATPase [Thermoplasmata archaeon]|nr:AAA family ATPase [Thermoplasmata archaeon]